MMPKNLPVSSVTQILRSYQKETNSNNVIPTSELYSQLQKSSLFRYEQNNILNTAKRNGLLKKGMDALDIYAENKTQNKQPNQMPSRKIFFAQPSQFAGARMFVRMIATLEMIAKDVNSNIAVRYGNRQDFKAALKLIEKIVLPKYFGLLFPRPLFDDYNTVEPYPSWDFWEGC